MDSLDNLLDYIKKENPQGLRQFLKENGENPRSSSKGARNIIADAGEESVAELYKYHPDKDTILDLFGRVKCSCQNHNKQVIYQPNIYWFGGLFGVFVLLLLMLVFTRKTED